MTSRLLLISLILIGLFGSADTFAQKKRKKNKNKKAKKTGIVKAKKDLAVENPYANMEYERPNIDISEVSGDMSRGTQYGFEVMLANVRVKDAEKEWKKKMKKLKAKVDKEGIEIFANNAQIASLSMDSTDIYATFRERDSGTKIIAFFEIADGFITSGMDNEKAEDIEQLLTNFALEFEREAVEDELDDAEKDLKKSEKSLKKLEGQNEDLHKKIAKLKQAIIEAEQEVEQNLESQVEAHKDIKLKEFNVEHIANKLDVFPKK